MSNQGDFLNLTLDELERLNLEAKKRAVTREPVESVKQYYLDYLEKEQHIKAVSIAFSDIEGRLHILDYDKKFFLRSHDNLTFDGSSIRGFTELAESDLRLDPDWYSFRWLPAEIFGDGKVLMFSLVCDKDGSPYGSDLRSLLKTYTDQLYQKDKTQFFMAVELEGFLLDGEYAEQEFDELDGFTLATKSGYFSTLPKSVLRTFIDRLAEFQRALGFQNEKDHPEVGPAQFELNYSYADALISADQIQLYKIVARQVANNMGLTASFLPKPFVGVNGNGMHTNISLAQDGKNLFYDASGKHNLSSLAWDFLSRILNHAPEICLCLNASVNAYRRLDPNFEAPNEIKVSPTDRGSMIRLPIGNEKSTRIEVRSVGPDANPYLVAYTLLRTGLEGQVMAGDVLHPAKTDILPGTISEALTYYAASTFAEKILSPDVKRKYGEFKQEAADRAPRSLGTSIKNGEILYHHEVTNQLLWMGF